MELMYETEYNNVSWWCISFRTDRKYGWEWTVLRTESNVWEGGVRLGGDPAELHRPAPGMSVWQQVTPDSTVQVKINCV